jgi:hypothetical protein
MRQITVTVDAEGGVVVKAEGYTGHSCKEATKALVEALGQQQSERLTEEYFQTAKTKQTLDQ